MKEPEILISTDIHIIRYQAETEILQICAGTAMRNPGVIIEEIYIGELGCTEQLLSALIHFRIEVAPLERVLSIEPESEFEARLAEIAEFNADAGQDDARRAMQLRLQAMVAVA